MLGWIVLGFTGLIAVLCFIGLCRNINSSDGGAAFFLWGLAFLFITVLTPTVVYYQDTIHIPEEYIMFKETIQQTKDLITNSTLNLADVEMNKSLAGLIKERNLLLMRVRANNRSPWALFKIDLKK